MREKIAKAIAEAHNNREENSYDHEMFTRTPDRREFAEADGDVPGKHLTLKQKKGRDSDRMPSVEDEYNSSSTGRYSTT